MEIGEGVLNFIEIKQEIPIQQFISEETLEALTEIKPEEIYIKEEPIDIFIDENDANKTKEQASIVNNILTWSDTEDYKDELFSSTSDNSLSPEPIRKQKAGTRRGRLKKYIPQEEWVRKKERTLIKQRDYMRERRKREKEEDEAPSGDSSGSVFSKREIRLAKQREYARRKRNQEKEAEQFLRQEMEKNLLEDRLSIPNSSGELPKETEEIIKLMKRKEKRLAKQKRYAQRKRKTETAEEREERLAHQREKSRLRRLQETEEQRRERSIKNYMRQQAKKGVEIDPEKVAKKKELYEKYKESRRYKIASMSPEELALLRQRNCQYQRERILRETPEQRERRLEVLRNYSRGRHKEESEQQKVRRREVQRNYLRRKREMRLTDTELITQNMFKRLQGTMS